MQYLKKYINLPFFSKNINFWPQFNFALKTEIFDQESKNFQSLKTIPKYARPN